MRRASWLLLVCVIVACGRTQRGEPKAPELQPGSPEIAAGGRLYRKYCYQCHPGGGGGLGPALNNKPLPELAIRTQIRNGIGAMPAFDESWLTDDEVHAIAKFVHALRRAPKQWPATPPPEEGQMVTSSER
ncbi:MAG TPA: cytochrome c [Kofleriaceae bacterium]|nr:cytochrome c [Kofleriaceae bacterium]